MIIKDKRADSDKSIFTSMMDTILWLVFIVIGLLVVAATVYILRYK